MKIKVKHHILEMYYEQQFEIINVLEQIQFKYRSCLLVVTLQLQNASPVGNMPVFL